MFFKIRALKNFARLRIKERHQHRCFPVRSSHQEVFLKKDALFCKLINVNILIGFLVYLPALSVCFVKINFSNCNSRKQNILAWQCSILSSVRFFFSAKKKWLKLFLRKEQLIQSATLPLQEMLVNIKTRQPPRTPFSQNTYLKTTFEYSVQKNSQISINLKYLASVVQSSAVSLVFS